MARTNDDVAAVLEEYADLLAITGHEDFKIRVYQKAARSIGAYPDDIAGYDAGALRQIPNVGESIAAKVAEYLSSGTMTKLEELRGRVPAGVRALTHIPTLGPKRAMELHRHLGVDSPERLEAAIQAGALHGLPGFGPKTEENLLHGIALMRDAGERVHLGVAMPLAEDVVAALQAVHGCRRCDYAGSLRRMKDTIGDIDVLATSNRPRVLMDAFAGLPQVSEVIVRGDKKTSVRTVQGLQVDLRVVPPDAWGAAMQYFTGAKAHNIRTREIALHHKLKLSEYGVFDAVTEEKIVSKTEEEVYRRLGLPWIPPTLREDTGEIEAALAGELPELVTEADVRGDLHTHTDLTDGHAPLEDMVAAAAERGYAYYAVTDHGPDLYMQQMTLDKATAQRERLRRLDGTAGLRLLHGIELNIDPDGEVDWPPDVLADFDLCVASVHSHFDLPRAKTTRRLVRAARNPRVNIIGHPSARLIGRRPPIDADWDQVFQACARSGTALEINAFPDRLDLAAELIRRARSYGVRFAVDSDAHAIGHLANIRYGIGTAQRGWLTAEDVINTWPLDRLTAFLRKNR
ncbi:DNA polymerase/3'-5' exonuclease PolX [Nonomuraea basaltis]|uniref:DNA polymerase/3'-5' exonuclease PolX n=1 Tax=Nonomuraea basaltis TaxID=2495887 RepID=UPI00110C48A6|nr:DNA polymerase/3'-5' exonuclease PolX [Nonomuraea basaltis]TMS00615.1 DNA polymerase/3'-5' exonuclease PolX [Nonomuraea basaltis]